MRPAGVAVDRLSRCWEAGRYAARAPRPGLPVSAVLASQRGHVSAAAQDYLRLYELRHFADPMGNVPGRVPSIAYEFLRRHLCIVMYKAPGDTPVEEWSAYIDFLEAHAHYGSRLKLVVHNEDGGTSIEQKARLGPLLRENASRVAVISAGARLRFMVSIVSAWNRNIKMFAPAELEAAFEHLQSDEVERGAIEGALERLRARIAG